LLTEAHGVPIGLVVAGANRHGLKLVTQTVNSLVVNRPRPTTKRPQGMCLDKGYDYEEVRVTLREFGFTAHIRARGEEAQVLKRRAGFKARRWVVERTHSWLNRFRRILIRWDKRLDNYIAFLHFACALIAFRAAGLFG
jgi:putative transposase